MKPCITPARIYADAQVEEVAEMNFVDGCEHLIKLINDAKDQEVEKPMMHPISALVDCDYNLLTSQDEAQVFWRGIIKMVTRGVHSD
ncbi:MAG: hypothetical protein IBX43_05140 [Campylobacterales bacterium]|nr:hypothetical protein [Campylobacterales bacterium]